MLGSLEPKTDLRVSVVRVRLTKMLEFFYFFPGRRQVEMELSAGDEDSRLSPAELRIRDRLEADLVC